MIELKKTIQPPLSIVVGIDKFGGFAKNGEIPWHDSNDLKQFAQTTKNGICIMGRRTYENMCDMLKKRGKDINDMDNVLPGRTSFVLTKNTNYEAVGATAVPDIRRAWQSLDEKDQRQVFILGGERVYIEALVNTTTIHLTIMKQSYDCDKFFPINTIKKHFTCIKGNETDNFYHMIYHTKNNMKTHRNM
jgi:dihydrofolate reductase